MKYYKKMLFAVKWLMIISIVLILLLGATVLKHHMDVRKESENIECELEKLRGSDGKLPED